MSADHFLSVSRHIVDDTMHRCHDKVRLMYAEVPEDYDSLGDGPPVSSNASSGSNKNGAVAWSWSDYKKESACESELRFIQPQVGSQFTFVYTSFVTMQLFVRYITLDFNDSFDIMSWRLTGQLFWEQRNEQVALSSLFIFRWPRIV